ncbi:hypothetical protein RMCBS344292_10117 [Rhizopus microsporus]|nr:hypothetical protein RMCBS344292_10117 [Rhizopus microsporus]
MSLVELLPKNQKPVFTALALLSAVMTVAYQYYRSKGITLSERMYFLLCQRNIEEATVEHELSSNQNEPDIISEHTQFIDIRGRKLRIVHIIHELGSKVPLIVFIHGLGGQVSQWQRQIEYFSQTAHILAVDLLGCGKSEVTKDWESYTTEALVEDIKELLTDRYKYPSTVIIAHSYGCAIASFVAACPEIRPCMAGLVLISPKEHVSKSQLKGQQRLKWIPDWLLDIFRTADRKGLYYSKSVNRFLGPEVNESIRKSQLLWNLQSKTPVTKRFLAGARLPTKDIYSQLDMGVLLIGGEKDQITPPDEMHIIRKHLIGLNADTPDHRVPVPHIIPNVGHMPMVVRPELVNPVISDFLIHHCGLKTLSGAWQILHKTKGENKWDLKNYEKWVNVANITDGPIGPSLFRAMKVMRQTDTSHSPSALLAKYPEIRFIIDISNDTPPYRASDFEHSRIEYIKFKTVSKIPPTREEVAKFIEIADACWAKIPDGQIAVHCHYGFNRTGFFIVCYMIERLGVSVPDALEHFKQARPPGIRHAHFVDELYLRYVLNQR